MFTGIIEEVGKIKSKSSIPGGICLTISATKVIENVKIGDSISVNGICLTVTKFSASSFNAEAVGETTNKTAIIHSKIGGFVNLERAVKVNDRLGGHIVQGHVAAVGFIREIKKMGLNYSISIEVDKEIKKYLINEGSVAVDGISLTIAKIFSNKIILSIIPHTWMNTNLKFRKVGDTVNIEPDVLAKYADNFLKLSKYQSEVISENKLINMGY